jgi:hypothetical protein
MQNAKQKFFKDRSVFYTTFPILEQAKRGGNWNFELNAVYTIGILDFIFDEDKEDPDKYFYHVQLTDTETFKIFYKKLTLAYLVMPKFNKTEEQLETLFDKWFYVIKNLQKFENRPKALQERIFQNLFKIAEIENMTSKERRAYDESLKHYWDMKNVIDTAVEEAVQEAVQEREEKIKEMREEIDKEKKALAKEKKALAKEKKVSAEKDKALAKEKEALAKEKKISAEKD